MQRYSSMGLHSTFSYVSQLFFQLFFLCDSLAQLARDPGKLNVESPQKPSGSSEPDIG